MAKEVKSKYEAGVGFRGSFQIHPTIDEKVRKMLFEGTKKGDETKYRKKLNIGCGVDYLEGFVNIDSDLSIHADHHINLDNPDIKLPFDDGHFELIYAAHILEHIQHLQPLKKELMRVLIPYGEILVIVPHFTARDAWGDPTHCRAFSEHSFFPQYWPGAKETRFNFIDVRDSIGNENQWLYGIVKKDHGGEIKKNG